MPWGAPGALGNKGLPHLIHALHATQAQATSSPLSGSVLSNLFLWLPSTASSIPIGLLFPMISLSQMFSCHSTESPNNPRFRFKSLPEIWNILATITGEGNGTPLQYSCLENPMDGGTWWAAVHGVVKSWTQLSNFTSTFHFHALEKEMATHSSVLAWRIPGTGEPGGLLSMGSHRVGHDWSDLAAAAAADTIILLLWIMLCNCVCAQTFSHV